MLEVAKGLPKGPARVGTVRRGAGRGCPESAGLAAGAAGPTRPPAPRGCRSHAFVTPPVSANGARLPSSGFPFDPSYSQEALETNTGPTAAPGATANSRQTSQPRIARPYLPSSRAQTQCWGHRHMSEMAELHLHPSADKGTGRRADNCAEGDKGSIYSQSAPACDLGDWHGLI